MILLFLPSLRFALLVRSCRPRRLCCPPPDHPPATRSIARTASRAPHTECRNTPSEKGRVSKSNASSGGQEKERATHSARENELMDFCSGHPYRRPQSRAASGSSTGAGSTPAAPLVRSRRVSEPAQMPQTPQTSVGFAPPSVGGAMPTVGTAIHMSCPASSTWREGLLGLSSSSSVVQAETGFDPDTTPGFTPRVPAQTSLVPRQPMRRYTIRTDIYYSTEENVITAMFELPGVERADLHVTMSVCPFSRVRQVSISGISRSILPLQGHSIRERKFGEFFRTLAVPSDTRPEDVAVTLEDGILILKIPGGTPAQAEQPQEIRIQ